MIPILMIIILIIAEVYRGRVRRALLRVWPRAGRGRHGEGRPGQGRDCLQGIVDSCH